jgi:hypothetical protein
LEFCDLLAMDFTALVNFCNSSLINRNSFAMSWAISSFMLHPFFFSRSELGANQASYKLAFPNGQQGSYGLSLHGRESFGLQNLTHSLRNGAGIIGMWLPLAPMSGSRALPRTIDRKRKQR